MNDDRDYFAPRPTQPTIYCQDVCRPGWVQHMPEPPAEPLYVPAQGTPPNSPAGADAPPPTLDEAQLYEAIRLIDLAETCPACAALVGFCDCDDADAAQARVDQAAEQIDAALAGIACGELPAEALDDDGNVIDLDERWTLAEADAHTCGGMYDTTCAGCADQRDPYPPGDVMSWRDVGGEAGGA